MADQMYWLENTDDPLWGEAYQRLPKPIRDVYYHPEYVRLYTQEQDQANLFVYAKGEDLYYYPFIKAPVPLIDGYFDISAFYGYAGPITTSKDGAFVRLAYEAFYREAIKHKVIAEVIKFHPLLRNNEILSNVYRGRIVRMCSTVYVDLGIDEDHRWKDIYTHANRKNINKARRQGIEVRFDQTQESWEAFLKLYEDTMRANEAAGFYYFEPEYYRLLREEMAAHYILASCWMDGKAVAVMLVLLGDAFAHCHLAGISRQALAMGTGNYLHHELIGWCRKKGYQYLHIGGGRTDKEDDPLLLFKKNFSDKTASFFVGECVLDQQVYSDACLRWGRRNPQKQLNDRLLKYRY